MNTLIISDEERDFLTKLLYHEYLACPDTGTMKKCDGILRKLEFDFPGFDYLIDKGGRKGYDT